MKWVDKETFLEVSELNTENKISISMGEEQNEPYSSWMQLGKDEITQLRDFLNGCLEQLQT